MVSGPPTRADARVADCVGAMTELCVLCVNPLRSLRLTLF